MILIPTNVYFESTGLTVNSTTKELSRSVKTGLNQFTQLWVESQHDLWPLKALFAKYMQEQSYRQYHTQDPILIWYNIHSRTFLCCGNHLSWWLVDTHNQ